MPTISITGDVSFEGSGSNRGVANFVVELDQSSLQDVSVSFRTVASGFAIDGFDFFGNSGVLTFAPGEVSKTISVTHSGDSADDSDENYTLELHSPVNGDLEGGAVVLSATGIITDDGNGANDLALFVSDPKVLETDGASQIARFEVRLSQASASDIALAYTTRDGTALAGSDYTETSGTVTFAAGQTAAFVDVPILGNTLSEMTEAFSLVVTPTAAIGSGTQDSTGIATIYDDDSATSDPVINISGGSAREGSGSNRGSVEFQVSLSESSLQNVTVGYMTRNDGSAADTFDFFGDSGTITFAPGETNKIIRVTHVGDSREEQDQNYSLVLYQAQNATLAGGGPELTATGVLLDDNVGPNVALFVSNPVVSETDAGGQQAVFSVQLSRPAATDITLSYQTRDGTALAGEDYTARTGTVTFLAGQTLASIAVDLTGDEASEATESFSLVVTPNGFIQNNVDDAGGIATILDDDGPVDLPIISLQGDENREGSGSNRGQNEFVLHLSEPSLQEVTVQYRTVNDGSARETFDYFRKTGTVTFAPGETQKILSVTHVGDSSNTPDMNYTLQLHSPERAILSGNAPTLSATGVILDDQGGSELALFVSDPEVVETDSGVRQAVFRIELSEPSTSDITLGYQTADGTARAGVDYATTSGTVLFTAGQTLASVAVDVLGDTTVEGLEAFSLVVTPNGFIQNGTADSTGIATILDNDSATELPILSVQGGRNREGSGSNRGSTEFVVTLSETSLSTVEVEFRTLMDGSAVDYYDFFERNGTLTFAPGEVRKVIAVTHVGDSADETDQNYTLELHSPRNATLTGDVDTIQATAVILDDQGGPNLALFVSDPKISETDSEGIQAVFTLQLSAPATSDITLGYQTADGSATAGLDYGAVSGDVTFLAGQTLASVAVDIIGDDLSEMPETFSLVVTPNGFIQNVTDDSSGVATIFDDDTQTALPIITILGGKDREGAGSNRGISDFIVSLSEASLQTVTVDFQTDEKGSAAEGVDFAGRSGTVTFRPGETQQRISITHYDDSADESDENYSISLRDPTNAILSGEGPVLRATGIILDDENGTNDLALFVSDPELYETDSGQVDAIFDVTLSSPLQSDITLNYATRDGTARAGQDYVAVTGTLTFLAGQTVAAVKVPVIGDIEIESAEDFVLVVTPNGFIQNGTQDSTGTARILNDDTHLFEGTENNDTITGTSGNDTLVGFGGDDLLNAGEGNDSIVGGIGTDTAVFGAAHAQVQVTAANGGLSIVGPDGTDFVASDVEFFRFSDITLSYAEVQNLVNGTDIGEAVNGTAASNIINARAGADWITPGAGSDRIDGGTGRDMVSFVNLVEVAGRPVNSYRLSVDLGAGTATSYDGDTYTLTNVERVTTTVNEDYIRGSAGDDEVRGLGAYDWILATTGNDSYDGGTGRDMVSYLEHTNANIASADTFGDGAPLSGSAVTGVLVDLANNANNLGLAAGHTYQSIERITGSSREDVFWGDGDENDFRGAGGYDWFVSSTGGRERYFGGSGLDTVTYFNASAGVEASLRNGAMVNGLETGRGTGGDAARDLFFEIENLVGSAYADSLTGNAGRNELNGLAGDDFLFGFGGVDRLKGGQGNDILNGGGGSDYALYDGSINDYTLTRTGSNTVQITGASGTDLLTDVEYFQFADAEMNIWAL